MALSDEHRWICETKNFDEARYYREKEADEAYLAGLAARRGETEERPQPKHRTVTTMDHALKAEVTALRSEVASLRQQLAAKVEARWVWDQLCEAAKIIGEEVNPKIEALQTEVKSLQAQNVMPMRGRNAA
jgi:hypothetical protein